MSRDELISSQEPEPSLFSRLCENSWVTNITIALVCFVLVTTFWPATNPNPNVAVDRVPCPTEYQTLARHLAKPFLESKSTATIAPNLPGAIAELQQARIAIASINTADDETMQVCQRAIVVHDQILEDVTAIQSMPEAPHFMDSMLTGFLRGFTADFAGAIDDIEKRHDVNRHQKEMLQNFAIHLDQHKAIALLLPHLAEQHAGTPIQVDEHQLIQIEMTASWGPFQDHDWITLTNKSGTTLHHCTLLIEMAGHSGQVCRNAHFVAEWPAEAKLYAKYSPGTTLKLVDRTVEASTVRDAASMTVSIWSEEVSQTKIHHQYWGKTRDKVIADYCRDLSFDVRYRPYAEGVLWNDNRAVVATLKGVPWIGSPAVTVQFHGSGENHSQNWSFDSWSHGESRTLDTAGKLKWDPVSYQIEVRFPDTGYEFVSKPVFISQ